MTSERSKRRDFLSLIFISKSISKKLLINQGITWHKAEVTYRKGISSVRIQQETNLYVYAAWEVAHDIPTSALMWQNKLHFVLINKNVGRGKKNQNQQQFGRYQAILTEQAW